MNVVPFTLEGGMGHANTYSVVLLLYVTIHRPLYSVLAALYGLA